MMTPEDWRAWSASLAQKWPHELFGSLLRASDNRPSRESSHFAVSQELLDSYRRLAVARSGGIDEYRRLNKWARRKAKREGKPLKPGVNFAYAGYPLKVDTTLTGRNVEFRLNEAIA